MFFFPAGVRKRRRLVPQDDERLSDLRGPVPMGMVHLACHCSKNLSTDICILER